MTDDLASGRTGASAGVPPSARAPAPVPVRIWDLPTRLFHWTLVGAVVALVVSGKIGGNAIDWHMRIGYLVMALLLFRLIWGFAGGRWSRFVQFVRGPGAVLRYVRGTPAPGERFDAGHNPLGALSVLAMLALLAAQVATGLVADDEIATRGPLNALVSGGTASAATGWHTGPGQLGLIALVLLHVGAIAYYRRRRRVDLLRPMLHGDQLVAPGTPPSRDDSVTRGAAVVVMTGCAVLVALMVALAQ